ncbi:MAG TPA: hypothetical protein VML36_00990 [Nitrospiria bacterium]|nr:hypothetical protein [Nitrospiria bacterium]
MNHLTKPIVPVVLGLLLLSASAQAAEQKTVLMLGGKFCDFYPKEITDAMMAVKGVTSVDLKSMKGHAVVSHDATVNPATLVTAMKAVKGTKMGVEWYCTAEAMQ